MQVSKKTSATSSRTSGTPIVHTMGEIEGSDVKKGMTRSRVMQVMGELDNLQYFQHDEHRRKYIRNQSGRIAASLSLIGDCLNDSSVVLDLGIAPYFFAHVIRSQFKCKMYGVGLSAGKVDGVEENFEIPTHYCNMETEDLPFEDAMFDVVLFTEVLEHLVMSPSRTVAEIHRVLKTGGVLLVSTPNAVSFGHRLAILFGHNIFAKYSLDHVYGRHNRLFTKGELKQLLEASNFNVERCSMFSDATRFKKAIVRSFVSLSTMLNPNLGDHIILRARAFGKNQTAFPESLYRGSLKTD